MVRVISFQLDCIPPAATAQQKRLVSVGGKPRFFKSAQQSEAESLFMALLLPYKPSAPIPAPVDVEVRITWPYLKGTPKRIRESGVKVAHTSRPDLDNWAKGFIDLLVSLRFIEDDAHIGRLVLSKERGPSPGVHVTLIGAIIGKEVSDGTIKH